MASDMVLAGFASCLKIEKKLFEELIDILKQEENALMQGNFNKLDDFVSKNFFTRATIPIRLRT